ncbi:Diaminopimelate decarboxylase [Alloactinosynnema sp. L-07]|nr:Diaminopimelate decarboxylase [Alloactinosynnema sp. L-07]
MTLAELVPSIGLAGAPPLEEDLWPAGTRVVDGGDVTVGGVAMTEVAARFGTPCQVLAEAEIRRRARRFHRTLDGVEIVYAGKALPCAAAFRWADEEGLSLDVCSAGELAVARAVGFPAERILLHGNVKTDDDLKAALSYGVGRIVVDSADEIDRLAGLTTGQDVLVRVTPGVDAHTHRAIATGVEGQKFGLSLASGAAATAVGQVLAQPGLRFAGLHCHLGSQVRRVAAYEDAARRMVGLIADLWARYQVTVPQLDLGGGFAVPYLPGEADFDLLGFATRLRTAVTDECAGRRVPVPRLAVEPGRSLVATAGVTLYRVVSVKDRFVAVDGGMSDNPRPALYGVRYAVRLVGRTTKAVRRRMTVVGRHCEAGDIVAEDVPLPADIHSGDLLAVPVTGAYHHAMAANYNQVGRPPIIGVCDGSTRVLVRRETEHDLLRRDVFVRTMVATTERSPTMTAPQEPIETDYTGGGVPTFDYVRERVEGKLAGSAGATELAGELPEAKSVEEQLAEREKAGKSKLEEIRRAMRGEGG